MTTQMTNAPAGNEGVQENSVEDQVHLHPTAMTERERCMALVKQHSERLRSQPPKKPGLRHDGFVQGYQHLANSLIEHDLRLMWMSACPDCRHLLSELAERLKPKEAA